MLVFFYSSKNSNFTYIRWVYVSYFWFNNLLVKWDNNGMNIRKFGQNYTKYIYLTWNITLTANFMNHNQIPTDSAGLDMVVNVNEYVKFETARGSCRWWKATPWPPSHSKVSYSIAVNIKETKRMHVYGFNWQQWTQIT